MYKQNLTKVKKVFKQDRQQQWLDKQQENSHLCMRIQGVLKAHKTWLATKAPNDGSGHNNYSGNDVNADNVDIGDDGPWPWWMDTPP